MILQGCIKRYPHRVIVLDICLVQINDGVSCCYGFVKTTPGTARAAVGIRCEKKNPSGTEHDDDHGDDDA